MNPEEAHIRTVDIPNELLEELQRLLHPYSVAIARVRNNDPATFSPLGSGVLAKRGDLYGVLTAHHCLHACDPEVVLGEKDGDTLLLILRGGRQIVIEPVEAIEVPLAYPEAGVYGEYGPDLTFIQIVSPDRRGSLAAVGTFWNLDRDPAVILERFSGVATPLASVGYPGVDYRTTIGQNDVHHLVKNMTYANALGEGDVTIRGSWDYIDLTCTYTDTNNLPSSFAGVSGGPVWAYELRISKKTGKYSVGDFALVGVKFWQTALVGAKRQLRAHFVRSIYEISWNNKY